MVVAGPQPSLQIFNLKGSFWHKVGTLLLPHHPHICSSEAIGERPRFCLASSAAEILSSAGISPFLAHATLPDADLFVVQFPCNPVEDTMGTECGPHVLVGHRGTLLQYSQNLEAAAQETLPWQSWGLARTRCLYIGDTTGPVVVLGSRLLVRHKDQEQDDGTKRKPWFTLYDFGLNVTHPAYALPSTTLGTVPPSETRYSVERRVQTSPLEPAALPCNVVIGYERTFRPLKGFVETNIWFDSSCLVLDYEHGTVSVHM